MRRTASSIVARGLSRPRNLSSAASNSSKSGKEPISWAVVGAVVAAGAGLALMVDSSGKKKPQVVEKPAAVSPPATTPADVAPAAVSEAPAAPVAAKESPKSSKDSSPDPKALLAVFRDKAGSEGPIKSSLINDMRDAASLIGFVDRHGRGTATLQAFFDEAEEELRGRFTDEAAAAFQAWVASVGGKMKAQFDLPEDNSSYWHHVDQPMRGFVSNPTLPTEVDILIIGAGLTGASAAYHCLEAAKAGKKVVVVDAGSVGQQASGRNGGNFELVPENFFGVDDPYEGLEAERFKYLRYLYPNAGEEAAKAQAHRQAKVIVNFASRNCSRFVAMVKREGINCDLSTAGWLRIADNEVEEKGIHNEVAFVKSVGIENVEIWPAERIQSELGLPSDKIGRNAVGNGNYHPIKFMQETFAHVTKHGVELYSETPVRSIRAVPGGRLVETDRGAIRAKKVIVGTNAFTATILPELHHIWYFHSHVMNLEHVKDTIKGFTITEKRGDVYYNFPGHTKYVDENGVPRGNLLIGGGLDSPGEDPHKLTRNVEVARWISDQISQRLPDTKNQPPSRVWTGPMAFTRDRLPIMGFHTRPGDDPSDKSLIVAAGFNGYGGSYCCEAGYQAARMALTEQVDNEACPEDVFSAKRFFTPEMLTENSNQ